MTHFRRFVLVACSVAPFYPTLAQAQINPFRSSNCAGLHAVDIRLMNDAASKLLERPDLNVGTTETWANGRHRDAMVNWCKTSAGWKIS